MSDPIVLLRFFCCCFFLLFQPTRADYSPSISGNYIFLGTTQSAWHGKDFTISSLPDYLSVINQTKNRSPEQGAAISGSSWNWVRTLPSLDDELQSTSHADQDHHTVLETSEGLIYTSKLQQFSHYIEQMEPLPVTTSGTAVKGARIAAAATDGREHPHRKGLERKASADSRWVTCNVQCAGPANIVLPAAYF